MQVILTGFRKPKRITISLDEKCTGGAIDDAMESIQPPTGTELARGSIYDRLLSSKRLIGGDTADRHRDRESVIVHSCCKARTIGLYGKTKNLISTHTRRVETVGSARSSVEGQLSGEATRDGYAWGELRFDGNNRFCKGIISINERLICG